MTVKAEEMSEPSLGLSPPFVIIAVGETLVLIGSNIIRR